MSTKTLTFAKGPEQPPEPVRVSDNLRSEDQVEVLLALGEGPWSKLNNGLKSFYIANTPLMASDGTLNFPEATLVFHKGTSMPDPIKYHLGGSASGHSVGVNLSQNEAVTRSTTTGDIDAIDVRIRIDQLMENTEEGDQLNLDLLFRVEVKPTSSGTWQAIPPNTGWLQNYVAPEEDDNAKGIWASLRQRVVQIQQEEAATEYEAQVQAWQEYQDNADGPLDVSLGVQAYLDNIRIYGRTQSPVMKEIRIPVVRLPNDTYDIRVTKISAESTSTRIREVTWDTFEQVTIEERAYPNTAMAQLLITASDQLSNLPQMYGIYDTAEILVPTIFDPETRSYDFSGGPWDGTFKVAFTDDLAWIIYDLVHNDVHGIAAYHSINFSKYEALEASIYWNACDPVTGAYVGVPRPAGGTRPRVTFNGVIDSPRNSMELLTYLAGAGNAVFYEDVEGAFRLRVEEDTPATQTFNNMDVENGRFNYSFTDVNTRYNDITVVYRNNKLPIYQEDRRRVFDQADIDLNGSKPLTFVAVGCVDTDEALARAYHKLITSLTETKNIAFTTTRFGAYVEPHDIILVADEAMDEGISRRCVGIVHADNQTIAMNEPLVLESGVTDHVVRIQTKDGIREFQINEGSQHTTPTQLRLTTPIPVDELDDNFSFSVASASQGELSPYRVTSIDEGENDRIKISAVQVNRSKYTLIDNFDGTNFDIYEEDFVVPSNAVTDIEAVVTERQTTSGKVKDVELTWVAPTASNAGGKYVVQYSHNDEDAVELYRGSYLTFTHNNVETGKHTYTITAVLVDGTLSPESRRVRLVTDAPDYGLPSITGVRVENRKATVSEYIGRSPTISWTLEPTEAWDGWDIGKPHPEFNHFQFEIVSSGSGAIVHTATSTDWNKRTLELPYNVISTLALEDIRNYAVVVSVVGSEDTEGSGFSRALTKPVYSVTGVTPYHPETVSTQGRLRYTYPDDVDFVGLKVWISDSPNAHTTGTLAWEGTGEPFIGLEDGTNYIAYQTIDVFGTLGQTINEIQYTATVTPTAQLVEDIETELEAIQQEVDDNTDDVADLVITYGNTQSSAAAQAAAESARDLALGYRDAADIAKAAAETAKGLAETAQVAAETAQVSASESAGVAVRIVREEVIPSTMANAGEFFSSALSGTPDSMPEVTDAPHHTLVTDSDGQAVRSDGETWISTKGLLPIQVGSTYRTRVTVKTITAPTNSSAYFATMRKVNELFDQTGVFTSKTHSNNDGNIHTYDLEYTVTQADWDAGTRYIRPAVLPNSLTGTAQGDGVYHTYHLSNRDITSEKAAEDAAVASATSATAAGVSKTEAGESATAAFTSETNASTSAGNAFTSETNAATSETNAFGSEQAAATSETNAATSESNAFGSASAAATSASNANTSATDAGTFSSASQSSAVTASNAADAAIGAAVVTLPSDLAYPDLFAHDPIGIGTNNPDVLTGSNWEAFTDPVEGTGIRNVVPATGDWISHKTELPFIVGNTYKISLKARETTTPVDDRLQLRLWRLDSTYQGLGNYSTNPTFTLNQAERFEYTYTATQADYDGGVRFVRASLSVNLKAGGTDDGVWEIWELGLEDVTSQVAAATSATASAASASAANTSKTEAGESATAADTSAVAAATSAGNAFTSETNAATSETNAFGSASGAATSETNAATSESNAGNSATAAGTSETNAGTSATNADASATIAQTSELVATASALQTMPSTFENGKYFSYQNYGVPSSLQDVDVPVNTTLVNDLVEGFGVQTTAERYITTKQGLPLVVGDTYRLTVRLRANTVDTNNGTVRVGFRRLTGNWTNVSTSVNSIQGSSFPQGEVVEHTHEFTATQGQYDQGARWIRAEVLLNFISGAASGNGDYTVFNSKFENITAVKSAESAATAAATSASNASASETDAGEFATAAQTAKTEAETAEGNASASETAAATSATNAAGSATAAGTSETVSAQSATAATNAAIYSRPETFENGSQYFTTLSTGAPEGLPDAEDSANVQLSSDTHGPYLRNATSSVGTIILQKAGIPYLPNNRYRVTAVARHISGTSSLFYLRGRYQSSSYGSLGVAQNGTQLTSTNPETFSFEFTATQAKYDEGTRYVKAEVILNNQTTGVQALYTLKIENITSEFQSETSATASASSASDAATSKTDAGAFATAAQTAKTQAETAEGNAFTSATNAATSATTAEGAATSASTSLAVVAKVAQPTYLNNPNFTKYTAGSIYPEGIAGWNGAGGTFSREATITKFGEALRANTTSTGNHGFQGDSYTVHNGDKAAETNQRFSRYFVLSAWVYLESGDFSNTGILLTLRKDNNSANHGSRLVHFHDHEPTPQTGKWYYIEEYFDYGSAIEDTVTGFLIYGMNNYSLCSGEASTKNLIWASLNYRPATASEIEAGKVENLQASVSTNSTAISTTNSTVASHTTSISSLNSSVTTQGAAISDNTGDIASLTTSVGTANTNASAALSTSQTNEGTLAASVAFRATAGNSAQLELFAMDSPNGSVSTARIAADNIILDGTVKGKHIEADSVTADKMDVTSLSAVSATIGTFKSATSGARLELKDDRIVVYDASGNVRVKIGNLA